MLEYERFNAISLENIDNRMNRIEFDDNTIWKHNKSFASSMQDLPLDHWDGICCTSVCTNVLAIHDLACHYQQVSRLSMPKTPAEAIRDRRDFQSEIESFKTKRIFHNNLI